MQRTLDYVMRLVCVAGLLAVAAAKANAAGTLILLSSATYDDPGHGTDVGQGVTVDDAGNIIVTGQGSDGTNNVYLTVKYDPDMHVLSTATYVGRATGVAADASGNVIVTGNNGAGGTHFLTIKYDPSLQVLSSATFRGAAGGESYANAVAVDALGNSIVVGAGWNGANGDFYTIKYDTGLQVLSTAVYDGPANSQDWAYGVAVDSSNNVIVTGQINNGAGDGFCTIKYDPDLQVLSSATFHSVTGSNDTGKKVAVDVSGNIAVTGQTLDGTFTIKYDPFLHVLSSAACAGLYVNGMAADPSGDIILTGSRNNGANYDYCTIKYDPDLCVLSSATYNDPENGSDFAYGVALDRSGNIIVTGGSKQGTGVDFFTLKYNGQAPAVSTVTPTRGYNSLVVPLTVTGEHFFAGASAVVGSQPAGVTFISSTTLEVGLPIGMAPGTWDVTVTNLDGLSATIPHAYTSVTPFRLAGICPSLVPLIGGTTITLTGFGFENGTKVLIGASSATAVTVLSTGTLRCVVPPCSSLGPVNVTLTRPDGETDTLTGGLTYVMTLSVADISPVSGPLTGGTTITLAGTGFINGAAVFFGDAPAMAVVVTTGTLHCITPPVVTAGAKDVYVVQPDSQTVRLARGFTYEALSAGTSVDASTGGTATITPETGEITVSVPAGAFGSAVTVRVATATVPASGQSTVKVTNVGLEVTNNAALQPNKEITITVYYRDGDIAGLDENKLSLARYDNGRWIPIPTVVYADQNKLVGTIKHLSTFAVVQLAPAADLAGVKVYPNPFDPKNGSLTIANLTNEAEIKIYTVAGELVRTLPYTSANGQAIWDGKNDGGNQVASGVYLAFIKSPQGKKILKIAVER